MEGFVLEASRIAREKARGIWPGRVATDYLDRWVAEKPLANALVAWRLDEERETRLSWRALADAAARGAELAVLPENFSFMGATDAERAAAVEPYRDGPAQAEQHDDQDGGGRA